MKNTTYGTFNTPHAAINIAFVGSSCSGKSSVLTLLKKWCSTDSQWSVHFIEEAATEILEQDRNLKNSSLEFQKKVLELQRTKETASLSKIETGKRKLLLCDRAIADAFVYQPREASDILGGMTLNDALMRYQYCFYFLPYYTANTKSGNTLRCETTVEEISALENRTRAVYMNHKQLYFIPSFDSVDERAAYVKKLINSLLGENVFSHLIN